MRARADFFAPDFTASQNWRGQWGPKTNFFRKPFIGKNYFLPAFDLTLDLFRTIGQAGEKLLSLAKQNNGGARYLPLDGKRRIKLKLDFPSGEMQKLRALPGSGSVDFRNSINWRGRRGAKDSFLKPSFTGKTSFISAFFLGGPVRCRAGPEVVSFPS